ncbi:MAG TPA: DNA-formamidopyrimidine glycosylase family protein [Thermodesulfobacteriota bacterium]
MPEGDTIFRTAEVLRAALAGKTVAAVRSPLPHLAGAGLAGRRVTAVEPRGKHLLVRFDDGRVLHSHMRMTGSWHVYRPGEPWRKPAARARVVLETAGGADAEPLVAVCFDAPVVELLSAAGARRHRALASLGEDLLADDFDPEAARRALRHLGELPVGEAVMVQQAIAGVGNIYKSETLFLCRVDPFAPVGSLSDEDLDRIIAKARSLLVANRRGYPRRTVPRGRGPGRLWVYGRSGEPCAICGTAIRMRRQGAAGRSTYWCPACQPPAVPTGERRATT